MLNYSWRYRIDGGFIVKNVIFLIKIHCNGLDKTAQFWAMRGTWSHQPRTLWVPRRWKPVPQGVAVGERRVDTPRRDCGYSLFCGLWKGKGARRGGGKEATATCWEERWERAQTRSRRKIHLPQQEWGSGRGLLLKGQDKSAAGHKSAEVTNVWVRSKPWTTGQMNIFTAANLCPVRVHTCVALVRGRIPNPNE